MSLGKPSELEQNGIHSGIGNEYPFLLWLQISLNFTFTYTPWSMKNRTNNVKYTETQLSFHFFLLEIIFSQNKKANKKLYLSFHPLNTFRPSVSLNRVISDSCTSLSTRSFLRTVGKEHSSNPVQCGLRH